MLQFSTKLLAGTAFLKWPSSIYEHLEDGHEIVHCEECDFLSDEEKIGTVEVKVRLIRKCNIAE